MPAKLLYQPAGADIPNSSYLVPTRGDDPLPIGTEGHAKGTAAVGQDGTDMRLHEELAEGVLGFWCRAGAMRLDSEQQTQFRIGGHLRRGADCQRPRDR